MFLATRHHRRCAREVAEPSPIAVSHSFRCNTPGRKSIFNARAQPHVAKSNARSRTRAALPCPALDGLGVDFSPQRGGLEHTVHSGAGRRNAMTRPPRTHDFTHFLRQYRSWSVGSEVVRMNEWLVFRGEPCS
jgi:hypothetical protein